MLPKVQNLPKTSTSSPPPKKNQKWVIICLGLTIFLSLSFLIYRKIIPILNGSVSIIPQFSNNFDEIPPSWSIYIGQYSDGQSTPLYSKNFSANTDSLITQLKSIPPTPNSLINSFLPQGTTITQVDLDPKTINFQYLISLPKFQLVMVIQNSTRSETNLKLIPQIVSTLYWGLVGSR